MSRASAMLESLLPRAEANALARERASDHFHDACGVFGIHGHDEAAHLAYLGLYALQHRGQESCGIVASDCAVHTAHRAMGLVADNFRTRNIERL